MQVYLAVTRLRQVVLNDGHSSNLVLYELCSTLVCSNLVLYELSAINLGPLCVLLIVVTLWLGRVASRSYIRLSMLSLDPLDRHSPIFSSSKRSTDKFAVRKNGKLFEF